MIIGQVLFNTLGNRYLGDIGKKPTGKPEVKKQCQITTVPLTKKEKQRTAVVVILTGFVIFFWAGFEQAGGALTVYTDQFVNRSVFGFVIPTAWFQSVNPLFIIILAPIVSALWIKLSQSKRDLPVPMKMGLGMILLGVGYLILLIAIMKTGSNQHHIVDKANLLFIVVTYFFNTVGELFLSPVGLSVTSKISPPKYASLLMGVWLASSGIANILAGQLGGLTVNLGFFEVFGLIGLVVIVFGLILVAFTKKLVQMME
jgi:proton-dependent oligopeptide transporter, POT family